MKKKVLAIIEKGEDGGYSIYAKDLNGVYGFGLNEKEAKEDFAEVLSEQIEFMQQRTGNKSEFSAKDIEYKYDFTGFFKSFPYFNISELAKELGVNSSLLRRYKTGSAQASEKQKERIQECFDEMVNKLQAVKF